MKSSGKHTGFSCDCASWLDNFDMDDRDMVDVHGVVMLLQIRGLGKHLVKIEDPAQRITRVNEVYQVFTRVLNTVDGCMVSQLGDEFLFLLEGEDEYILDLMVDLHTSIKEDFLQAGEHHVSVRLVSTRQRVNLCKIASVTAPAMMPAAIEILKRMLDEAALCKAMLVIGENMVESISVDREFRLMAIGSPEEHSDEPLGFFEYLGLFNERDRLDLINNRNITDRAISSFYAGLLDDSRDLFFKALENAPFDSLPGRYLNLIRLEPFHS